jgi:sulfoacetaldehyde dehydrogenase
MTEMAQHDKELVDDLFARARAAQREYEVNGHQERYDLAAKAAAWALMEEGRNLELATMAVEMTGLGNVPDKVIKNHRKTLGLLRDLQGAKTFGIISSNEQTGITEIARPIGVIGAVVPSTNPVATPTNNIVNALKTGNAIVLSPSPRGVGVCEKLVGYIHTELKRLNENPDLVQFVPAPSSKDRTQRLMEICDLVVVTGSQDNVRRGYSAGTPSIGVGAGNVSTIVDETADLAAAAQKIRRSKTFDNATSCSSENGIIVVDAVRDDFLRALHAEGGRFLQGKDAQTLHEKLFEDGKLNRHMIARDLPQIAAVAGLEVDADARFLMIESTGIGAGHPETGEKLSLVSTLYFARDFADAQRIAEAVMDHLGAGHSVGLHSNRRDRALELGKTMPTCRVILNQAHCFATGGSFDNGMPFSLSMGCGSWGGNSIDDNLNYRHFMNVTKVVEPIPEVVPSVEDMFADYRRAVED